jgi:hypothetical protein
MKNYRHLVLLLAGVLIATAGFSQKRKMGKRYVFDNLSKGSFCTGLSASGNWFKSDDIGTANLKAGYFFIDQLNVGLVGEYQTTGTLKTQKCGGLYARYYFMNKHFSVFSEGSFLSGSSAIKDDPTKFKVTQFGGAVGLAYTGVLEHLGFEVFEDLINEKVASKSELYFLLSVRVNFFF